jgi:hypothetical protein
MARLTNKNHNTNYAAAYAAALPPTVRLEASEEVSVQEQLSNALAKHQVKLIDLFREWDDDGNGALDKKELRQAVAALGYDAPRAEVDALFESIDTDGSGWVEYEELKKAIGRVVGRTEHGAWKRHRQPQGGGGDGGGRGGRPRDSSLERDDEEQLQAFADSPPFKRRVHVQMLESSPSGLLDQRVDRNGFVELFKRSAFTDPASADEASVQRAEAEAAAIFDEKLNRGGRGTVLMCDADSFLRFGFVGVVPVLKPPTLPPSSGFTSRGAVKLYEQRGGGGGGGGGGRRGAAARAASSPWEESHQHGPRSTSETTHRVATRGTARPPAAQAHPSSFKHHEGPESAVLSQLRTRLWRLRSRVRKALIRLDEAAGGSGLVSSSVLLEVLQQLCDACVVNLAGAHVSPRNSEFNVGLRRLITSFERPPPPRPWWTPVAQVKPQPMVDIGAFTRSVWEGRMRLDERDEDDISKSDEQGESEMELAAAAARGEVDGGGAGREHAPSPPSSASGIMIKRKATSSPREARILRLS